MNALFRTAHLEQNDPRLNSHAHRRSLRAVIWAMVIAFIGGLLLMGWAITHWQPMQIWLSRITDFSTNKPAATPSVPPAPIPSAVVRPTILPAEHNYAQITALDSHLKAVDAHLAASIQQADRAEALLLAAAARRAVDRGVTLGAFEAPLQNHFGQALPRDVAQINAASHAPVTLDRLRAGLDSLANGSETKNVENKPEQTDWWTRTRNGIGTLFTVRKTDQPSPIPNEWLARARMDLSAGAVDKALGAVLHLPATSKRASWTQEAQHYLDAHAALDALDAAALSLPKPR